MTRIVAVTAGLGRPSSTRLLTDRLVTAVQQRTDATVTVVELREFAHDIVNAMLTGFPAPALAAAIADVTHADAVIAVSPIFNANYSGLFKSFFDVLEQDALRGTPVLLAATGGTERHSLALEHGLRPLFSYLRALTLPTAVYAASSDWASDDLKQRIERAADELAELLRNEPAQRPRDPFDEPTPFEELLAG